MLPIDASTMDDALALNNAFATELSLQTKDSFAALVRQAFMADWTLGREGFLIAFDETAAYAGVNFGWFRARYPRFVYVDRVVVRPQARGQGHAGALYRALFSRVRASGRAVVTCEVNEDPPNPASDAFHERLGFRPVGGARIDGGAKAVRYLALDLQIGA